jgi:hypothetical protein
MVHCEGLLRSTVPAALGGVQACSMLAPCGANGGHIPGCQPRQQSKTAAHSATAARAAGGTPPCAPVQHQRAPLLHFEGDDLCAIGLQQRVRGVLLHKHHQVGGGGVAAQGAHKDVEALGVQPHHGRHHVLAPAFAAAAGPPGPPFWLLQLLLAPRPARPPPLLLSIACCRRLRVYMHLLLRWASAVARQRKHKSHKPGGKQHGDQRGHPTALPNLLGHHAGGCALWERLARTAIGCWRWESTLQPGSALCGAHFLALPVGRKLLIIAAAPRNL